MTIMVITDASSLPPIVVESRELKLCTEFVNLINLIKERLNNLNSGRTLR